MFLALFAIDLLETLALAIATISYAIEWVKCDGDENNSMVKYSYCAILVINFLRSFRALRIFNNFRTNYILVVNTLKNLMPMLILMTMTACVFVFTTRATNGNKTFKALFFE